MEIRILTVGKIKERYLNDGIAEYAKRLSRYCKLTFCQVPDEKTPDKASDALNEQIKANMPSRIAFSVSSGVDSRTILDMNGAEKLLGKGDMLFYPQGYQKPARLQGAFVSDEEVSSIVEFLADKNPKVTYNPQIEQQVNTISLSGGSSGGNDENDIYFVDAGKFIIEKERASIGMLQRMFKIGFNRAARIMDQLSDAGVVGPEEGTKPRKVLMSMEEFETYIEEHNV